MFRVSLALLQEHKAALLACQSFESIMEHLRSELPKMSVVEMERVLQQVFVLDLKKKIMIYEVEFAVVQEESQLAAPPAVAANVSPASTTTRRASALPSCDLTASTPKARKISTSTATQATAGPSYAIEKSAQTTGSPTGSPSSSNASSAHLIYELQQENKEAQRENMELIGKLHVAQSQVNTLESQLGGYTSTIKRLEVRVRTLEDERDALLHSVNILRRRCDNLETAAKESALPQPASGAGPDARKSQ